MAPPVELMAVLAGKHLGAAELPEIIEFGGGFQSGGVGGHGAWQDCLRRRHCKRGEREGGRGSAGVYGTVINLFL